MNVLLSPETDQFAIAEVLHRVAGVNAVDAVSRVHSDYTDIEVNPMACKFIERVMNVNLKELFAEQGLDGDTFVGDILLLPFGAVLYATADNGGRVYRIRTTHPAGMGCAPYERFGQNKKSWKKR